MNQLFKTHQGTMQAVLDPSVLAAVKKLHQSGRYFDGWRMVEELPPPKIWSDLSAELNAATLIGRLGDSKRASKIVFQAWRDPINHVEAREAMFWEAFSKREAFLSWQSLMQHVPAPDEPVEKQADHEARMAVVLMKLRDFKRCEEALDKGMALQPSERFLHCCVPTASRNRTVGTRLWTWCWRL